MTRINAARFVEALEQFVAERAEPRTDISTQAKQKTANTLLDALVATDPGMSEWEASGADRTGA